MLSKSIKRIQTSADITKQRKMNTSKTQYSSSMNSNYTQPVNIGNPHEMTILELALLIKELTKTSSDITCQDLPQDDPKQRKPDITTANQQLLWTPHIELKDGLQQTIEYFKTKL